MAISKIEGFAPPTFQGPERDSSARQAAQQASTPSATEQVVTDAQRPTPVEKIDYETVRDALRETNKALQQTAPSLQFAVDDDTGITLIKLIDQETKQVVRQIPSEELLAIARAIDRFEGLFLSEKA